MASNTVLLRNLNRSKNPEALAKRHGFNMVAQYREYLERGIEKVPVKKAATKKVEAVNNYFLAVDVSGSTHSISKEIREGVLSFAKNLAKTDKKAMITVVQFGNRVRVLSPSRAVDLKSYQHRSGGLTPLHEAVLECIKLSKKNKDTTIVVFTDGASTSSTSVMVEAIERTKEYKGTIAFIGAGHQFESTALELGVPENNILGFTANSKGVTESYNTLNEATTRHAKNVKEGKGAESKTEYFKTKTDIATMLRKSANKEIKVAFEKKITEKGNEGIIYSYLKKVAGNRKTIKVADFDCKGLSKVVSRGELRVLRGSHVGDKDEFGRYVFTDSEVPAGKHATRLVNPDTIQWVEIDGVKYTKK